MSTRSRQIAATAATLLVLSGCGGSDGDSDSTKTEETGTPTSSPTSEAPVAPSGLTGQLMYSKFNESTHEFISTHLAPPDGSSETDLQLPSPEGGGGWSRRGDLIAVVAFKGDRIGTAIIKPDGTVVRTLRIPDQSLNLVCTVWSPDDTRLACEGWGDKPSLRGIYTVRSSDGGDITRLTASPKGMADYPGDYSPDGKQLIFERTTEEDDGALMLVDLAGGPATPKPRRLSKGLFEDAGRFSPDGKSVLTSHGGSLIILGLDGKERSRISKPGAYAFGADWSPDGKWIAFSRGTDGPHADIFISRPDGSEEFQVTEDPLNEIALDWGAGS